MTDFVVSYAATPRLNVLSDSSASSAALQSFSVSTTEGASSGVVYYVSLNSQPSASVTVTLSTPSGHCADAETGTHDFATTCSTSAQCSGLGWYVAVCVCVCVSVCVCVCVCVCVWV